MTEGISGPQPPQPKSKEASQPAPEDVQQYLQVQEEIKQMEALLTVAQSMVQKELQKAREKGTRVPLNFESMPVAGNAEQRGMISTFNDLQPLMAVEVQSLAKQTAILKGDNPAEERKYNGFLDQLEDIAKSFPKLSQNQIDTLNTISGDVHSQANMAGKNAQKELWKEIGNMYKKMYITNEQTLNELDDQIKKLQEAKAPREEIEGAERARSSLGGAQNSFGAAAAGAAAKGGEAGSLPDQFQKAIINHYMPQQEAYLMELAELLMFDNMGASIGNSLLNIITDFSAAATNFDFSNFLHGDGKGEFSGTPTQAQNQISKETSNAYKDLQEIKNAINKIDSEVKNIENDKNLTASQKQDMISKLQSIKANLQVSEGQVSNLYDLLKQLHVHPGSDSKHFKITGPEGWEKSLSQDENLVINGDPKSKPPGGLVQISSDVNTFQQTYSDQGQNQQMMLQMRMTEIQQEWTVVSTALQLLNQMYMTVSQSIYK